MSWEFAFQIIQTPKFPNYEDGITRIHCIVHFVIKLLLGCGHTGVFFLNRTFYKQKSKGVNTYHNIALKESIRYFFPNFVSGLRFSRLVAQCQYR